MSTGMHSYRPVDYINRSTTIDGHGKVESSSTEVLYTTNEVNHSPGRYKVNGSVRDPMGKSALKCTEISSFSEDERRTKVGEMHNCSLTA